MDIRRLAATVEADRRGILPPEKRAVLNEIRSRARRNDQSLAQFVEPMLTMATGAIAEPVSGFVGLAGLPFGVDAAANAVRRTQDALTYQPRTEAGQKGLQAVGEAIAPIAEPIGKARDFIADKAADTLGPEAGTAVYTALTAAPDLLGLKGANMAGKAGQLGKQFEFGDIGSQAVNRQRGAVAFASSEAPQDALTKALADFDAENPDYWVNVFKNPGSKFTQEKAAILSEMEEGATLKDAIKNSDIELDETKEWAKATFGSKQKKAKVAPKTPLPDDIGYADFDFKPDESWPDNTIVLEAIQVNEKYRGKGYGRAYMQSELDKVFKENPDKSVSLFAQEFGSDGLSQDDLVGFYKSMGFEIDDVEGIADMDGTPMTITKSRYEKAKQ